MRIEGWNPELGNAVIRLVSLVSRKGADDPDAELARRTGALPVYRDMGGALTLTRDGSLVAYPDENGQAEPLLDPGWRTLALVAAAERFPELASLRPRGGSRPCPVCQGTGRVLGALGWCSKCHGVGRVD